MSALPPPPPSDREPRGVAATALALALYTVSLLAIGFTVVALLVILAGEGEPWWPLPLIAVAFIAFRLGQVAYGQPAGTRPGSKSPPEPGAADSPPPPPPPG